MADAKISDLTAKTTPVGTDQFVIAESGGANKKVAGSDLYGRPEGRTGATSAARFVGATASGAPGSGTFAVGDFIVDQSGAMWVCTAAGSPGTWVKIGTSAMTAIASSVLGSAGTFDFNSIPGTYSHLLLILQIRSTANSGALANMTLNADTGANYYRESLASSNTTVTGASGVGSSAAILGSNAVVGSTDTAGRATCIRCWLPNYAGTTFHKEWLSEMHSSVSALAAGQSLSHAAGTYASTSAITRVQVDPSSGTTFVTGSGAWLYGIT